MTTTTKHTPRPTQPGVKRTPRPEIWQNPNGTFSHRFDSKREWTEREGCETDLRFTKEWMRGHI